MGKNVLLVYPQFMPNHILNYEYLMPFYPGKLAVMPPLGLLSFAGLLRDSGGFELRLVDENVAVLSDQDLAWADIVAVSGMHPQRRRITEILDAGNAAGKVTVLGGPSVSICPEYYPQADLLHVGEIGDASVKLIEALRGGGKPPAQRVFRTVTKLPLEEQPLPAIEVVDVHRYVVMPLQWSVGCPFRCEFCDIPVIYGRVPRMKSGARVAKELDRILATGFIGTILFVDDNLIANRKELRAVLPAIIAWQKQHDFPFPLTGEASIDLAREEDLIKGLREARFTHVFFGIESPEAETLVDIDKPQNLRMPLLEAIRRVETSGIEAIFGIIFGFDTDTPDTGRRMSQFLRAANAPIIYFNLLAALPGTPLWDRLLVEGRLLDTGSGDSRQSADLLSCVTTNVQLRLPNEQVVSMLHQTVREVYEPAEVFRRMTWNAEHVYGTQVQGRPPTRTLAETTRLLRFSIGTFARVFWGSGVRANYRRHFWRFAVRVAVLRLSGRVKSFLEVVLRVAPNAHHLITWAENLLREPMALQTVSAAIPVPVPTLQPPFSVTPVPQA